MKTSHISFIILFLSFFTFSLVSSITSPPGGNGWVQLPSSTSTFTPRVYAAYSGGSPVPPPYDPSDRSGIAIFGGTNDPNTYVTCYNDLWILNPQDGRENDGRFFFEVETGDEGPSPRALAAIAIDSTQTILYLYGGFDGTNWYSDLWTIDLTPVHYLNGAAQWVELQLNYHNPPVLCGMTLTWSGPSEFGSPDQFVLFGGGADKRQLYNNVYILTVDLNEPNGTTTVWHEPAPDPTSWPPAREFHTAWLDDQSELTIFGGYDYGYYYFNDTWQFNNFNNQPTWIEWWSAQPPPPSRCSNAVAYSISSDEALIWGGRDATNQVLDDMWVFYKGNWTEVRPTTNGPTPLGRFGMVSGYFEEQNAMIIWGGMSENGTLLSDTWYFSFQNI